MTIVHSPTTTLHLIPLIMHPLLTIVHPFQTTVYFFPTAVHSLPTADASVLKALREFGMTDSNLKTDLAELKAVEAANLVQEKEKGDAQAATQKRDQAVDALQDWMSDFIAIAKVALKDNSQLLRLRCTHPLTASDQIRPNQRNVCTVS